MIKEKEKREKREQWEIKAKRERIRNVGISLH